MAGNSEVAKTLQGAADAVKSGQKENGATKEGGGNKDLSGYGSGGK